MVPYLEDIALKIATVERCNVTLDRIRRIPREEEGCLAVANAGDDRCRIRLETFDVPVREQDFETDAVTEVDVLTASREDMLRSLVRDERQERLRLRRIVHDARL